MGPSATMNRSISRVPEVEGDSSGEHDRVTKPGSNARTEQVSSLWPGFYLIIICKRKQINILLPKRSNILMVTFFVDTVLT